MFCEKCGTQNPDEAVFCAGCGAELPKINVPQGQPNVQASPQGIPNQQVPEGQPVYQQPVRTPRKPMPMGAKIAIIAIVAVAILGTAGFMILRSLASPKRIVENYAKAYVAHDSEKIFDLLCFEKSEFITPDALEKTLEARGSGYKDMTEYTVKEDNEDEEEDDKDTLYYTIVFRDNSHSNESETTVTLEKSGKQFVFFDDWKMRTTDFVAKEYGVHVPAGTTAKVDGVALGDKYSTDEQGEYLIPSSFDGKHTLSVESDIYEPYETEFTVSATNYDKEDAVYVYDSDLKLSSATEESLASAAKETATGFYSCALEQKAFSEVASVESIDSDCNLESEYNDWISNNVTSDTCIKSLEFTNTEATVVSYNQGDGVLRVKVDVTLSYNTTSSVKDFWSDKKEKRSGEGSGTCSLYYEYQDGQWMIYDYSGMTCAIDYQKY